MHILLVTTYFEPDSGAAAVRLSRLARLLHERGHEITVLTTLPHYPQGRIVPRYHGNWTVKQNRAGLRIIRAWLWATPSPRISRKLISQLSFMLTALLTGVRLPRPDVMLIEAQPVFTSLAGVLLSQRFGAPYVLNVSDLWPDHLLSVGALTATHPVYRAARHLVDLTYRHAASIVALSPLWAEKITGYVAGQTPVQVIFNGVDLQRFRPDLDAARFRQQHGLEDCLTVTFIGTLATQYDMDALLRVMRAFRSQPQVRFVLIGAGSQHEALQQLTADDPVTWIDWLSHDEIPLAWATSDITFWAIRPEALYRGTIPARLYEALATGTPVAALMEGAGADLLAASQGGLCVPYGDVGGLTATIQRLVDDPALRQQLGQQGAAYARQHFDPAAVAARYESVLQSAVRN
jgi:glycosyltransferase involved in cell wall biosynthesis